MPKGPPPPPELPGPLPTDVPAGGLDVPPLPPKVPGDQEEPVEAFPGEFQLSKEERERWLVLHFALPRTIMTCDMAEGRSTEAELNDVLSAMAWGRVDPESGEWRLEVEEPSPTSPEEGMISYADHIERTYPTDTSVAQEAQAENARLALERRGSFTAAGEPGVAFRPAFDMLVKNLAHSNKALMRAFDLKKPVLNEDEVPEDDARPLSHHIMRFGRHQVLPAFWQLMAQLTKRGRRFSIVFHAFSAEQLEVLQQELQVYCQGQHPAYDGKNKTQKPPMMSGEKGSRDMRLLSACVGRVDRASGRLTFAGRPAGDAPKTARPGEVATSGAPERPADEDPDSDGDGAAQFDPTVYSFPPYYEVYAGLQHQVLDGANTAAIVEDIVHWREQARDGQGGQLLLVDAGGPDSAGPAETRVQHLFFDGHGVQRLEVRDVVSGEVLPEVAVDGLYLHKVDLFRAIMDVDYFVRAVEDCELRFSQRILASRRPPPALATGSAAEEDGGEEPPPKEYLYRHVLPALLPALEVCQRDRPADPIEYIALYMLRHSKQYSKTLKS
mmetsp:Transcript_67835/g.196221  ORF Transcript_67835/g.196221 Transcript_67835/m.196221 type:complete len:554 (-) Transcript_67835:193-1854(-)